MADNYKVYQRNTGLDFAADDISSVYYPRTKLVHGADGTNDGDVSSANPLPIEIPGTATGGVSAYNDNDLDETAVAVKASQGNVYGFHVLNTGTGPVYLQMFNLASGSVTVGTTTPDVEFAVPGASAGAGGTLDFTIAQGIAFSTAITIAATTDSEGSGAPSANQVHAVILYK